MDTTTLVNVPSAEQRELGMRAADALRTNDKLSVRAIFWWFDEAIGQWKLLVSTPVVRREGPRKAYTMIRKALEASGLDDQIPIDHVWAVEDKHPIVSSILSFTSSPHNAIINCVIDGLPIPGAYTLWIGPKPTKKTAKPRKRPQKTANHQGS